MAPGFVHLVEGTLVGEYVVEKLLGAGGMGAVYGARHERLGRRAALKVIAPSLSADRSAVERFEGEAEALARLSHPGIVAVLGVGTLPGDGRSYFVMEWLDGMSLHDRLNAGPVRMSLALEILDQSARALDAAHRAGIVHRDFKPGNLWLQLVEDEATPVVKILDFGLAKLVAHRRSEHTAVGTMFGTSAYMSPEQCRSTADVGPPTDVYALGCVAYELFCNRLPFTYDNLAELVVAHQMEEPPRPQQLVHIDSKLDTLLFAMLAKDPSQRPTLAQVRAILGQVRAERAALKLRATTLSGPGVARSTSPPARHAGVVIAVGLVLLTTVVVLGAYARTGARDATQHDVRGSNVVSIPPADVAPPFVAPPPDAPMPAPLAKDVRESTPVTSTHRPSADAATAVETKTSATNELSIDATPDAPEVGAPEVPKDPVLVRPVLPPHRPDKVPPPPPQGDREVTINPFARKVPK